MLILGRQKKETAKMLGFVDGRLRFPVYETKGPFKPVPYIKNKVM